MTYTGCTVIRVHDVVARDDRVIADRDKYVGKIIAKSSGKDRVIVLLELLGQPTRAEIASEEVERQKNIHRKQEYEALFYGHKADSFTRVQSLNAVSIMTPDRLGGCNRKSKTCARK